MNDLARRFKALSEELRLQILALLVRHEELCVCEVERFLGVSQSAASRHFRYLASAGLVESRRDGQWVYYRVAPPSDESHGILLDALRSMLDTMVIPSIGPELAAMREDRCSDGPGCSPETTSGAKEREAEMEVAG
jgi:ArsR family transcriptional regulator